MGWRRPAGLPGSDHGGVGAMARPPIHARPRRLHRLASPIDSGDLGLDTTVGAAVCMDYGGALGGRLWLAAQLIGFEAAAWSPSSSVPHHPPLIACDAASRTRRWRAPAAP
ncbi:unnamed protein product [Urochloa humidicola]